jgi:hypothetical protein
MSICGHQTGYVWQQDPIRVDYRIKSVTYRKQCLVLNEGMKCIQDEFFSIAIQRKGRPIQDQNGLLLIEGRFATFKKDNSCTIILLSCFSMSTVPVISSHLSNSNL